MPIMENMDFDIKNLDKQHSKTVLLWGEDDLAFSAVRYLLLEHAEWYVISKLGGTDQSILLNEIDKVRPDVVVMYRESKSDIHVPLEVLDAFSSLTLITFSLESNELDIYSRKKICIHNTSDFIAVVDG